MKKSKIIQKIQKNLRLKMYCSFFRNFESRPIHGYILAFSADFVLIYQTYNFSLEGYAVLPISTLDKVLQGKKERMCEYVMNKEGELDKLKIGYEIDLTNWQSIFHSIAKEKRFAIVECEQPEKDRFLIGKIMAAKKKKIELTYFDALGFYDDFIMSQKYKQITIIRFDEPYINTIIKYLRNRKKENE